MKTEIIEYSDNQTILEGVLVYPNTVADKLPAVLVAHDWSGRNPRYIQITEKIESDTRGRTRTGTPNWTQDFKSCASTCSATRAVFDVRVDFNLLVMVITCF